MSPSELWSYAIVLGGGAAYWAWANGLKSGLATILGSLRPTDIHGPSPAPAPTNSPQDEQQRWVATLLILLSRFEESKNEQCAALVRELIWRMIGGPPNTPAGAT